MSTGAARILNFFSFSIICTIGTFLMFIFSFTPLDYLGGVLLLDFMFSSIAMFLNNISGVICLRLRKTKVGKILFTAWLVIIVAVCLVLASVMFNQDGVILSIDDYTSSIFLLAFGPTLFFELLIGLLYYMLLGHLLNRTLYGFSGFIIFIISYLLGLLFAYLGQFHPFFSRWLPLIISFVAVAILLHFFFTRLWYYRSILTYGRSDDWYDQGRTYRDKVKQERARREQEWKEMINEENDRKKNEEFRNFAKGVYGVGFTPDDEWIERHPIRIPEDWHYKNGELVDAYGDKVEDYNVERNEHGGYDITPED